MFGVSKGLRIVGLATVVGFVLLLVAVMPIEAIEVRGTVANVMQTEVTWDNSSFAGFYYDIDKNLGAETLTFRPTLAAPTGATISGEQDAFGYYGIIYKTNMRQVTALSNAKIGMTYGKLTVDDINSTTGMITLDNRGNQFTLSKNKTIELMPGFGIRTANQDGTDAAPLRYYIYKEVTTPGTYELRGAVADSTINEFAWDNSTFPGFYYDLNKNLGAETLTFTLSDGTPTGSNLSDQPDPTTGRRGVVYKTSAQLKIFKYKPWGQYDVIGFLGEPYFAAYDPTVTMDVVNANENVAFLYDQSINRNLMTSG